MRLSDVIRFQKALALAASASNPFEAAAAELAARRTMKARNIDPTRVPDKSFLSRHIDFTDNPLLRQLREEYRALHPTKSKPRTKSATPVNTWMFDGLFEDFMPDVNTKPKSAAKPKPVNTKPHSDRNRDRHSPGYMRNYMRRRRAKK